jgi:Cys-rich four helix bundle protein (predicted Tat secretion target)
MQRREILLGLGVSALGALAVDSFALQHEQHAHSSVNQELVTAASNCVSTGEICMNHCHDVMASGDKSLVECARRVYELIAACTALRSLAAQNSGYVPKYAKLTAEVCKTSEAECRKFAKDHPQCKECADSCLACMAACSKVA